MYRKVVGSLMVVLVAVLVVGVPMLAAEEAKSKKSSEQTLMGTIDSLDAKKGMLTLKTADGKTMPLKVSKKHLEGLQVGDHVKVAMMGKRVKMVEKEKMEEKMAPKMEEKKS